MKSEKGKIYLFDGQEYIELEKNEMVKKIPITEEALEQVKSMRSDIAKRIGRRPELDVISSAMIDFAAKSETSTAEIEEYIKNFYISFYSN